MEAAAPVDWLVAGHIAKADTKGNLCGLACCPNVPHCPPLDAVLLLTLFLGPSLPSGLADSFECIPCGPASLFEFALQIITEEFHPSLSSLESLQFSLVTQQYYLLQCYILSCISL